MIQVPTKQLNAWALLPNKAEGGSEKVEIDRNDLIDLAWEVLLLRERLSSIQRVTLEDDTD